jgi:hypothetical protein
MTDAPAEHDWRVESRQGAALSKMRRSKGEWGESVSLGRDKGLRHLR